jgi:hypothetical protein
MRNNIFPKLSRDEIAEGNRVEVTIQARFEQNCSNHKARVRESITPKSQGEKKKKL